MYSWKEGPFRFWFGAGIIKFIPSYLTVETEMLFFVWCYFLEAQK